MVIEKIKPTTSNTVRITLPFSPKQIAQAGRFRPEALQHRDEKGEVLFSLSTGSGASQLGKYGMRVPEGANPSENALFLHSIAGESDELTVANLANAQGHMAVIEPQVKQALADYETAAKAIKEV